MKIYLAHYYNIALVIREIFMNNEAFKIKLKEIQFKHTLA